jgi:hypothetical protein
MFWGKLRGLSGLRGVHPAPAGSPASTERTSQPNGQSLCFSPCGERLRVGAFSRRAQKIGIADAETRTDIDAGRQFIALAQ